jgi:hypothetical protein
MSATTTPFAIGPDGVAQIYPDKKGGTQVYMKNNPDKNTFNVSYGKNSHIPYSKKQQGSVTYFTTEGSPINYHSGNKSGRSVRIDTYPAGGMWKNKTKYYFKDNPGFLYTEKGILNGEFTTFIRVHDDKGTHKAYAHKVGGRDEDALRSLVEMVYPTGSHATVTVNYNYAHFPYVSAKPKLFGKVPELEEGKWIGVKTIHIVGKDSTHWEMWTDLNPFAKDGTIQNNWKKIAEYTDKGCDEYDNIPLKWRSHKEVCRVDGYGSVDFALFSDREIDASVKRTDAGAAEAGTTPQEPPKVDNTQDWNSKEEVAEAEAFIKAHPDVELMDFLGKYGHS